MKHSYGHVMKDSARYVSHKEMNVYAQLTAVQKLQQFQLTWGRAAANELIVMNAGSGT
jgi:hypothetical protein